MNALWRAQRDGMSEPEERASAFTLSGVLA